MTGGDHMELLQAYKYLLKRLISLKTRNLQRQCALFGIVSGSRRRDALLLVIAKLAEREVARQSR
jgi:hypothetical protein